MGDELCVEFLPLDTELPEGRVLCLIVGAARRRGFTMGHRAAGGGRGVEGVREALAGGLSDGGHVGLGERVGVLPPILREACQAVGRREDIRKAATRPELLKIQV